MRASAVSRISWDPTVTPASGTPIVLFAIPSGGNYVSGGGIKNLMLDGNAVAPVGLLIRSFNAADFDRMVVYACTEDQVLMQTADYALTSTAGASQFNRFFNCHVSTYGGSGWYLTNLANGFRLQGGSSFNAGDSSINTFPHCRATMSRGNGIVLESVGQDCFINCWSGANFTMTPATISSVIQTAGGTLANGVHTYTVQAFNNDTGEIAGPSASASVTIVSGPASATVSWGAIGGATGYRVFRTEGGINRLVAITGAVTSAVDSGNVISTGVIPDDRKAVGVILGSTDQARNPGTAGTARHHCFVFCEMKVWARASQLANGKASFGNMIYGISNGDVNLTPLIFEIPTNNTDHPTATYTTSGAKTFSTPALGYFGQIKLDEAQLTSATDPGPLLYLNRRNATIAGSTLGELRFTGTTSDGTQDVPAGRIASHWVTTTGGGQTADLLFYPAKAGADTQAAMILRDGVVVPDGITTVLHRGYGVVNAANSYWCKDVKVVGRRVTGWSAPAANSRHVQLRHGYACNQRANTGGTHCGFAQPWLDWNVRQRVDSQRAPG